MACELFQGLHLHEANLPGGRRTLPPEAPEDISLPPVAAFGLNGTASGHVATCGDSVAAACAILGGMTSAYAAGLLQAGAPAFPSGCCSFAGLG